MNKEMPHAVFIGHCTYSPPVGPPSPVRLHACMHVTFVLGRTDPKLTMLQAGWDPGVVISLDGNNENTVLQALHHMADQKQEAHVAGWYVGKLGKLTRDERTRCYVP
jgi:hypothetical protein